MNRIMLWRWGLIAVLVVLLSSSLGTGSAVAQGKPVRIIFMHHSTGQNLIAQGGVREALTSLGYEFWDHGYNGDGLVDAQGDWLGINWDMPGDNTDPDGWSAIFDQPVTDPPSNTFSQMLEYDVIIFKSCFPTSDIQSEEQFEDYRRYYLGIRDITDRHPDKLFIAFTPPPLVPNSTSPEAAARARRWAEYLASDDFLAGHSNLVVFNFFDVLADSDNVLRAEFRVDEEDSHPNEVANQAAAPIFVEFVDQAIHSFVPGEAPLVQPDAVEPAESEEPPAEAAESQGDTLPLGFEEGSTLDEWWTYVNDPVSAFDCLLQAPGYESEQALALVYDIPAGGNAGCGLNKLPDAAWAEAEGISFAWRADRPDLVLVVGIAVADPARPDADPSEATPFEIELRSTGEVWTQAVILWSDLVKADWVGDTGVDEFDAAQAVWYVFSVGHWELPQTGSIWIDDIQLIVAE